MKPNAASFTKYALQCSVWGVACTLLASPVIAGSLSDPVVEPPVAAPSNVVAAQCVEYVNDLVWWDKGTPDFVEQIKMKVGGNKRTAARLARQFCRESKLGNPSAKTNLEAGILAASIAPSNS